MHLHPHDHLGPNRRYLSSRFQELAPQTWRVFNDHLLVTGIMRYSVLPLGAYMTDDLDDGMTFPTALSGDSSLTFRKHDDGKVAFRTTFGNGQWAKVSTPNITIEAGPVVVHITDTALLPPGIEDDGSTDTETTSGVATGTEGTHDD
jgi:hypothetical protein